MQRFIFQTTSLALCFLFVSLAPVQAQTTTDPEPPPRITIPLEVALIYSKLLNTPPDFDKLALYSPKLQNTGSFGREALLTEEKSKLEKIYGMTKRDSLIVVRQPMAVKTLVTDTEKLELKDLDADTPFTYEVGNTTYGVFIRNASAMTAPIKPPYADEVNWSSLQSLTITRKLALVELILKPLGADDHNFTTFDDNVVKPIIADLIDIKIYDPQFTDMLLLHKQDQKAWAKRSNLENLVEDDLKDESLPQSFSNLPRNSANDASSTAVTQ